MSETREELKLVAEETTDPRNLPVPVEQPAPRRRAEMTTEYGPFPFVQVFVLGLVALEAMVAGAASPAGGLASVAVGLLGVVIIDHVLWRQHEGRLAVA